MSDQQPRWAPPADLRLADLGTPLATGRTAEVFALGDGRVLKLLLPAFPPDMAEHEADVAGLVATVYPFAPRFFGMATIDGRRGLVYERIDGPTMDSYVRAHLGRIAELGRALGALHATMHGEDGTGLGDQLEAFRTAIDRASADLPSGARDAALRRLEQLPGGTALCHGDLHPGNVILGNGRTVVIDWGNGRRGNPVADVARTIYLMRDTPMHEPRLVRPFVFAVRRRFVAGYLARYRELRPLDAAELQSWRLPILAARMAEEIEDERGTLRAAISHELVVRSLA